MVKAWNVPSLYIFYKCFVYELCVILYAECGFLQIVARSRWADMVELCKVSCKGQIQCSER